ncbi:MAG: DNA-directed RNA polymerase subunit beta [Spirochaetia bacterium]|nr:DNA-directed RNA polymerase subunit beta [Spirochaetia bacterium]MDD7268665.1 DNA-directed RNA polymerase subunit beta [Treponema sp.]
MFAKTRTINRQYIGKDIQNFMDVPNLIAIQTSSYESFLQAEALKEGKEILNQGLQDVFTSTFPIESPNGDMSLEYEFYELDWENLKFSELECKQRGVTYSVPLKARINLNFLQTGAILQKDIYMGDIPLMTDRGTFIINGAERVVVSQIHRSPGVIFCHDKGEYSSRIIPYRGSWLEFEIDQKKELIFAKIDRKKKILGTIFLRALGYNTREEIIRCFYDVENVAVKNTNEGKEALIDKVLADAIIIKDENGEEKRLFNAGTRLHPHDIDDLIANKIEEICVIRFDTRSNPNNKEEKNNSLDSQMIINCFEREEVKFVKEGSLDNEPTKEDCLAALYAILQPGEPMTVDAAEKDLNSLFFSERRYDLGRVGRYKLNKKFDYTDDVKDFTLIKDDIINTMKFLIKVYIGEEQIDDIDHLGNRRIRSVGELMTNQLKSAFARMERIAKERMSLKETDTMKPQDLISIKPIVAAIKEFFGSSQLSQFMDQINPLAELTHKRRLNALGPGGLSRDRAGFEVRDVHYSHYGRMCPIETPEGPNIGLIVSLAMYTRINDYGFLEAPFRKVENGKVTDKVEYLSAMDEDKYNIGQVVEGIKKDGSFPTETISCRNRGNYSQRSPKDVQYIDVSPRQVISVSASMIPFLEHDDANRALMGCNMQRQAVPLLFPEPPHVGTGMERKCARDSGVLIKAKHDGEVIYVSSEAIKVKVDGSKDVDEYSLLKYQRTNNDTCNHQRPTVNVGEKVKAGDTLADGPATFNGELALGRNILVGFVPWNGYNYEDAVLISQRVVREDWFTSIHIKEFEIEIRETKLGPERITRDIPNKSEKDVANLDAEGKIRVGAKVRSGDILVGKVTPKSETETTPEFKLLNSIFGEKAKEVRDSSLKVPHGIEGVVISVTEQSRANGDDLNPGVEKKVKVLIANKRKLREGDKMAGRHGNKGVVSRILPIEDMPYLEDGTPLDVCLNPLGVPSRMNIGQILESELGIAGKYLNQFFEAPVFQSPSQEQIADKLEEAGLPRSCKQVVHSGQTGEPFVNPIFVGVIYYMKLHHLVDDKMHARSTGPYSLVTQQPLGGKAQFGGQRLGEMEVWALEAYGAANTLQEMMTIKSDDMNGRSKIYESIVKGDPSSAIGIPESFNVLVQEMRGLALDFTIYDAKGKQIALTERDQELIDKNASGFDKEDTN